jgi:hypothetical protein
MKSNYIPIGICENEHLSKWSHRRGLNYSYSGFFSVFKDVFYIGKVKPELYSKTYL